MTNHDAPSFATLALPLGLGTNTFARTADATTSRRILDAFVAASGTLIDTADTYSDGAAETIVGDWLRKRGNRDDLVLMTKGGNRPPYDNLRAGSIRRSLDGSLRRLGTDHVDVYFAHYQDDATPLEESVAAFDQLHRDGKVRAIGLSNLDAATIQRWIDIARTNGMTGPTVLQPHYNLTHREPVESGLLPLAEREGLVVLPYRALAGGFLTGKYRALADTEGRARGAGLRHLLTPEGLHLVDVLARIADELGATPAAVALAWLRHQSCVVAPLASATTEEQLAELVASGRLCLSDAHLLSLHEASALVDG